MKQLTLPSAFVLIALFATMSCKQKQESLTASTTFNLDSARKSIDKQNIAFQVAFEQSDSVGMSNLFTADAKFMMPGAPAVVGREAIAKTVAVFMKMNIKRTAQTIDIWGNDELITEEGTASLFDQKGTELDHAKYLVVWKQENGQWKIFRDIWNTDLTPTAAK